MSNFKFLLSNPGIVAFAKLDFATDVKTSWQSSMASIRWIHKKSLMQECFG